MLSFFNYSSFNIHVTMALKLFIIFLGLSVVASRHVQFYRKDYTYFEDFDAFYKLHWDSDGVSWDLAAYACEQEDSELFYPKSPLEWTVVKNLTELMTVELNTTDIFVGIQNEGMEEFLTVDGLTTPFPIDNNNQLLDRKLCTTMDIKTGVIKVNTCFDDNMAPKPFVCKKVEPVTCPTIDNEYTYFKDMKKCYKVNHHAQTWHNALHTCIMEGGILAVIENNLEAELIKSLIQTHNVMYHVGFRRTQPSNDFYTIKGQQLQKVFNNFYDNNRNDDCGAVHRWDDPFYLVTVPCNSEHKFVCEISVAA